MAAPQPEDEATGEEDAPKEDSPFVVVAVRRALDWLRDLHRGYAYTGHLPRKRK